MEWMARGGQDALLAATQGPSSGVAAGLMVSGGLGLALPSAFSKRSRIFPEVFDDCSYVGRILCSIGPSSREVNEGVFALNFLESGGIGRSESCEQGGYSMLFTDLASPALDRLHSVMGSVTVLQSSRVARPQDASKAPNLVLLLSSSARSYLDASSSCF